MAGKKIFIHFQVSLGRDKRHNKEQNEVAIWPFQAKRPSYKSVLIDMEALPCANCNQYRFFIDLFNDLLYIMIMKRKVAMIQLFIHS